MLNAFARLGRMVEGSFLESLVNNPKEGKIVKVNFDICEKKLEFETEEADEEKARRYLFISMGMTGKSKQFMAAFPKKDRLLGERGKKYSCWISLQDELKMDSTLKRKVDEVVEVFYDKNNWVLKEEYKKQLEKYKKEYGLKDKDISFFTVLIDGKSVAEYDEYRELLKMKLLEGGFKGNGLTCGICGNNDPNTKYFSEGSKDFKFFITKQLGFSQNLRGKWEGNLVMCKDCYNDVLKGENLVRNYLVGSVEKITYMFIPDFLRNESIETDRLKEWVEKVRGRYDVFYEERKNIKKYIKYTIENNLVFLNWVFFTINNKELRVFGMIKDVVPMDVDRVEYELKEFDKLTGIIGDESILKGLREVYRLIPIRDYTVDIPKIVGVFNCILKGDNFDRRILVQDFINGARAIHYDTGVYKNIQIPRDKDKVKHFSKKDRFLTRYILKTNQLLVLMGKKGGKIMNIQKELEELGVYEYVDLAKFNEMETALFLIGITVGIIGKRQFKDYNHKPILDKINFSGMSLERVKILVSELYEKIHQLRLYFAEKYLSLGKKILDSKLKDWKLTPYENVYYILSGYAYENARVINRDENENKKEV